MVKAKNIGPLQLIAVGFDSADFRDRIAEELRRLSETDMIRVVDAVAAVKDPAGNVSLVQASGLTREEAGEFGSYIGALLGIGSGDELFAEQLAEQTAARFQEKYDFGLEQADINDITEAIPESGGALMMLIEHRWLIPLREAMADQGGFLLAQEFLSPQLLVLIGAAILEEAKHENPKVKIGAT